MISIYEPLNESGFELCQPSDDDDFFTIDDLVNGRERACTWKPLDVKIFRKDDDGNPLRESDSPWLGSNALIFRPRAIEALGATLLAHGELLPLRCDDAKLFMFNVTRVLPAIDEKASGVRYFDDGTVKWIDRYVFREDVIAGSDIFKLAKLRGGTTFVTRRFVDLWRSSGLKGLDFTVALGDFRFG